jgi:hypothetical protein
LPSPAHIRGQYAPHALGGGFAEGGTVALQREVATDAPANGIHGEGRSPGPTATAPFDAAALARSPGRFESAHWITRTALVVEARDPRRANGPKAEAQGIPSGVLYVFMPP